jgi:hypothetical protein
VGYSRAVKRGPFIFVSGGRLDTIQSEGGCACWLGRVPILLAVLLLRLCQQQPSTHSLSCRCRDIAAVLRPWCSECRHCNTPTLPYQRAGCLPNTALAAGTSAVDQATGRVMYRRDAYKQVPATGSGADVAACEHNCSTRSKHLLLGETPLTPCAITIPRLACFGLQTRLAFTIVERALEQVRRGSRCCWRCSMLAVAGAAGRASAGAGSRAASPCATPLLNAATHFSHTWAACRWEPRLRTLCAPASLCATCSATGNASARRTARWVGGWVGGLLVGLPAGRQDGC